MNGRTATPLIQEVTTSTGVDHDTAMAIAKDFLEIDISLHESPSREIEKIYMSGVRPGVDTYAFRLFIKEKYSLTDKQSSAVARGLRYRCDNQRDTNRALSIGVTEAAWAFRSNCPWRDAHAQLSGVKFTLESGLALGDGLVIRPGEQWLCACDFRVVIPERKEPKTSALKKLWKFIKEIFNK